MSRRLPIPFLLWLVLASGCVAVPRSGPGPRVAIEGVNDRRLEEALRSLTTVGQIPANGAEDPARLVRRHRADAAAMERFLHAEGRCGASVSLDLDRSGRRPVFVFTVTGTNLYHVRSVAVEGIEDLPVAWSNRLVGAPVNFARIHAAADRLLREVQEAGYPWAVLTDRTVGLDHPAREAEVRLTVDPRSPAVFGGLDVEGLRRVDLRFVEQRVTWTPGAPYRRSAMESFNRRLSESGLFSYVGVSGSAETSGLYEVSVRLKERRRHTVGLGAEYQSDIGPGGRMQWQQRNLFGMGQSFELDARYAEDLWLGSAVVTWPGLLQHGQNLRVGVTASEETSDAYDIRYQQVFVQAGVGLGQGWSGRYGASLRESVSEQLEENETYLQVSFPVAAAWNRRNDLLNPTRGFAMAGSAEPFYDLDENFGYLRLLITPAGYLPLIGDTLTLGARATLGSISGAARDDVPPDLRFYAGGGQSIRGYAYQSVGPREEGHPVGGLSLFETSLELRWAFGRSLGLVLFLDGGSAYEPEVSDFRESFQWGAGAGFRYFTGVGPIRIDVGVPVNSRDGIDNDFEFYISIGQAF